MKWGTARGVFCEGLVFQQVEEKVCYIFYGMLVCIGHYGWLRFLYLREFMGITNCGHGERMHSIVQTPEDLLN